ncbi:hypothetical protein ACOMHN_008677 [Nucella lapillus]
MMDTVTELLYRRITELEKTESYLQQQELKLHGHILQTQLTIVEQSERASHMRCAAMENRVFHLDDRVGQMQVGRVEKDAYEM